MTTPRVTVPVEPEGVSPVYSAAYDSIRKGAPGLSDATCAVIARSINMKVSRLSAAPAPEGGAGDWSYDLTSCPKSEPFLIAYDDGDVRMGHYLDNSKSSVPWEGIRPFFVAERWDAKIIAWAKRPALATREEAPADMTDCKTCRGNGEIVTDWERYLGPPEPGDQGDEGTADCPDCDGIGKVEAPAEAGEYQVGEFIGRQPVLCQHGSTDPNNLCDYCEGDKVWPGCAQPPAREDAQPVAWRWRVKRTETWHATTSREFAHEHDADLCETEPLYTHPAPDALRVAVEALTAAMRVMTRIAATSSANLDQAITNIAEMREAALHGADAADQALAALQAEQKGGA